jgi:DNA-directed RNA polymerase subunit alpha
VGKRTDYDRITLEIETDGTTTPEEAYSEAVEVLMSQFNAIMDIKEELEKENQEEEPEKKIEQKENSTEISNLELSTRIHNVLESNDVKTIEELSSMTENDLRDLSGMGKKGMEEIINAMKRLGFSLKQ